jgi:hypothetical protein
MTVSALSGLSPQHTVDSVDVLSYVVIPSSNAVY